VSEPASAPPPQPIRRVMSPCIGICTIDRISNLCLGCKRTIPEIGRWQMMDDRERQKVIDDLPNRKF
jgi:predicted Fe-S protein YdhL (DUF1289 family)